MEQEEREMEHRDGKQVNRRRNPQFDHWVRSEERDKKGEIQIRKT
jgi:hypothetical protein